ncbi:MAG TPA: hypothetical protein VNO30_12805 [Kofleriaceae bacterium]|nr:hypothetical protein [Kofleriaceae bacterium]
MKAIASMMLVALASVSLGGCLIRTHGHSHHHSHVQRRDCPPAYHWDGRGCVHNGRGHVRDHRR